MLMDFSRTLHADFLQLISLAFERGGLTPLATSKVCFKLPVRIKDRQDIVPPAIDMKQTVEIILS